MRISTISLKRACLLFAILLLHSWLFSQAQPAIRTSVDKNKIVLGESFTLSVEIDIPGNSSAKFAGIDSIPHFEFVGDPVIDSTRNADNLQIRGKYTLTSFDSGHWVIRSISITQSLFSDTIPIDVVFSDFNPEQPYHDIKDIIEVKAKAGKKWWLYIIAGALLVAALILYLVKRKKHVVISRPGKSVNAYEEALRELETLSRSKPGARIYYTKLVDIFRLYISRRKKIRSLQKTTDDLVIQLKNAGLTSDEYNRLSQALRMADFVKFAKYIPQEEDDAVCYRDIRAAIERIEENEKASIVSEKPKTN